MDNFKILKILFTSLYICFSMISCIGNNLLSKEKDTLDNFLNHYFLTWSKKDMKAYKDCFHKDARIQFIKSNGEVQNRNLDEFIAEQESSINSEDMEEIPLSKKINIYGNKAVAVVNWKLMIKSRFGTDNYIGKDHFFLTNMDGQWKIVSLIFYEEKK